MPKNPKTRLFFLNFSCFYFSIFSYCCNGFYPNYSSVLRTSLTSGLARPMLHYIYLKVMMLMRGVIDHSRLLCNETVVRHSVGVFLHCFYLYQRLQFYLNLDLNISSLLYSALQNRPCTISQTDPLSSDVWDRC